jgi:hypothetical protein
MLATSDIAYRFLYRRIFFIAAFHYGGNLTAALGCCRLGRADQRLDQRSSHPSPRAGAVS